MHKPITKRQILDSSKVIKFTDINFKFDKKWGNFFQGGRKRCGKRRNCSLRAISPFPAEFKKNLVRQAQTSGMCEKGLYPLFEENGTYEAQFSSLKFETAAVA